MKNRELVSSFFIGGCIGKTLMEISGIITNIFFRNNVGETIEKLKALIITFIIGGSVFIIAKLSIKHIEKKDMKSKDRQKLLKKQMSITGAILLFSIFLIVYMLNNNYVGAILALSFSTVFSFWGYAFLLSYINLKNNMALINKKS